MKSQIHRWPAKALLPHDDIVFFYLDQDRSEAGLLYPWSSCMQ